MADENKAGGTAQAAQAQDDLPEWLSQIPGVDVNAVRGNKELVTTIKDGWLRQQDYTKKTQEVAALRKAKEKLGDRDIEAELDRLSKWDQWHQTDYPKLAAQAERAAQLEELTRQAKQQDRQGQPQGPKSQFQMAPDDLFEQERLSHKLGEFEQYLGERTFSKTKEWWEKEELPRLDKAAQSLLSLPMNMIRAIWPKELQDKGITVDRVLKEAVASQNFDYPKLVQGLIEGQTTVKKEGFEEGYKKGLEEAKAAQTGSGSPPPPAYGSPTWRRPPGPTNGAKPSKGDLFGEVMKEVQGRHGALPV